MVNKCAVIVGISSIVLGYLGLILWNLGALNSISPEQEHGNENCEILSDEITDLIACEDIAQFVDGTVLLSCSKRDVLFNNVFSGQTLSQIIRENSKNCSGNLFLMNNINTATKDIVKIKLIGRQSPDFHSHGIGVITDDNNIKWIYVINHRRDGDVVEIFKLNKKEETAMFVDEVHSPLFVFINDVKPLFVNKKSNKMGFYVTNSFGWPVFSKSNMIMDTLLSFVYGFSDLVYCEQDDDTDKNQQYKQQWKCDVVDTNLAFGNGIEVSTDNQIVYAVETNAMNINVYRRKNDGTLRKIRTLKTHCMPDNLIVDHQTNDVYIGCHANPLQFIKHARNSSVIAPSQILHWNPNMKNTDGEIDELYLSNGHTKNHISGSSVGLYDTDSKTLLIGTANAGVMRCKL